MRSRSPCNFQQSQAAESREKHEMLALPPVMLSLASATSRFLHRLQPAPPALCPAPRTLCQPAPLSATLPYGPPPRRLRSRSLQSPACHWKILRCSLTPAVHHRSRTAFMWQQCQGRARRMCGHVRNQRWPMGLRTAQRPSLGHVCWPEYVWATCRLKGKLRADGCGVLLGSERVCAK